MPFVVCKMSGLVSREQEIELKQRLGRAIERVPGKSEQGLLVVLEDNARLWLAGDDGPVVGMRADAA